MERRFGRNTADKVDAFRIDVGLVFIGIILFSDGDASERRTLLAQIRNNGPSVNPADGWDTLLFISLL